MKSNTLLASFILGFVGACMVAETLKSPLPVGGFLVLSAFVMAISSFFGDRG